MYKTNIPFILAATANIALFAWADVINPPRHHTFDPVQADLNGFFYEVNSTVSDSLESLVWNGSEESSALYDHHWHPSESRHHHHYPSSSECWGESSSEHYYPSSSECWESSSEYYYSSCEESSSSYFTPSSSTYETPIPTSEMVTSTSESILPTSEEKVVSTVTVYANACTTLIICNPANTTCPNNVPSIASEVAKVIKSSSGATAIVNGTTVASNGKTVVVSGTSMLTLQAKNSAAVGAEVNFIGPLGTIGAFIVAAVFLLA